MTPRHKWNIIKYVGCALPNLSAFQKSIIRKQLNERYCPECGEYIYNPFNKRKIRHYHHLRTKHKFNAIAHERLRIYPHNQLVEWTRRSPFVMKLITSEEELVFYRGAKPRFVHRIPSLRMWTIDEWNILHPSIYIWKDECFQRLSDKNNGVDFLWTPDLVLL